MNITVFTSKFQLKSTLFGSGLLGLLILSLFACSGPITLTEKPTPTDDGKIEAIILHFNDVYEISPLEGGKAGGLARVAQLRDELLKENSNVLTVLPGDFLSPSLFGTIEYNNEKIRGKQMVEVLNALGLDLVTFGNHEFDIKEAELQERLDESEFVWLGTNVMQVKGENRQPFRKNRKKLDCPEVFSWRIRDADGTELSIGFFGATIPSNPKDYVYYEDYTQEAVKAVKSLSSTADLILGLTHLDIAQDMDLANLLPRVPLFMGGHDHDNMLRQSGRTTIAKADANVKTVYVHRIRYDKNTKEHEIQSELVKIDDSLPADPEVQKVVEKWENILNDNLIKVYPEPQKVVYTTTKPLDGLEKSIRNFQTNLGQIIAKSMAKAARKPVDGAVVNGGSVRIDDQISGNITAIDIFRALPFGGSIVEVDIKGDLLEKLLTTGRNNQGTGGYLQRENFFWDDQRNQWLNGSEPLHPDKEYHIAVTDFLLSGLETNMAFFSPENPGILSVDKPAEGDFQDPRADIRLAVIDYLLGLK
jgi:5'-nucleotidase/UDP-sugar diphosphatase